VIDLPGVREIAPERAAELRLQLVSTMLHDQSLAGSRTRPHRAAAYDVGAQLVSLRVGRGLAAALAITQTAANSSAADSYVLDADMLDVLYEGRRITQDDLAALTKVGRGTFTTSDTDTEHDLHAMRAFDTLEELDEYSADYLTWQKAKADGDDVEAWGTVRP
jgi:hypothetical protein